MKQKESAFQQLTGCWLQSFPLTLSESPQEEGDSSCVLSPLPGGHCDAIAQRKSFESCFLLPPLPSLLLTLPWNQPRHRGVPCLALSFLLTRLCLPCSPPKPTVFISGVIARGDKDFPPAAAQVAHQKPHASMDKHSSPRTQNIQQPRK